MIGYLTLADFQVYCVTMNFKVYFPDEYKEIAATFDPYLARFEELDHIKAYISSERYI